MTRRALLLAALVTLAAPPALGQTSAAAAAVARARAVGIVGERYDGYLGFAAEGSPSLHRQLMAINLLRRSLYAQLSQSRGVAVQAIGITAGCQLLATVQVGEHYFATDNSWHIRQPGQPAPIPDYCR